ncbi:FAD-binding oxidoreductase [Algihabitans albus]|uniref:FAD-binding oxidoreductase n=1 Tax=Algihabitans albus TaxID=2164067 RepID=UPI000E5CA3A7|nr:FAD-binding oxidoreductase [Algihabitans albus]
MSLIADIQSALPANAPAWLEELSAALGETHLSTAFVDRLAYARDRTPLATFNMRAGRSLGDFPVAVATPGTEAQVAQVLSLANTHGFVVIPYGAGSGVVAGAIPVADTVMLDLKRLNRLVALDEINGLATVQAGMNGARFEELLNERGWTCGHYPQSIRMSTVGGWIACRGAGQASSRYGKIEDMVVGLRSVMPDGELVEVRPLPRRAVGPGLRDLFVGAEGTLGVITEVTLRIWRQPEVRRPVILAFPDLQAAWDSLREMMQGELRPEVARLYDETESRERTMGGAPFDTKPILCILMFSGKAALAEVEERLGLEICAAHGAEVSTDLAPYEQWQKNRFVSYSPRYQAQCYFMDTIEITGRWSALPDLYARIGAAIRELHPDVFFGTHWSHVYPEGACQYMTIRLPVLDEAEGLRLHRDVWARAQSLCLELGGSISHHHGAGQLRNPWMEGELGRGHAVLQKIKDALDPNNVSNPGKLALRLREAADRG